MGVSIVSILIAIAIGIYLSTASTEQIAVPKAPKSLDLSAFYAVRSEYATRKRQNRDEWWLHTDNPTQEVPDLGALINEHEERIRNLFRQYAHVSKDTAAIADHFREFVVTVRLDEKSSMTFQGNRTRRQVETIPEICFTPESVAKKVGQESPSILYWRTDWGLMMNAISVPENVFAGFLFHEAGHGLRHGRGSKAPHYFPPMKEYFEEEAAMHTIEMAVINTACGGKFIEKIDSIIDVHSDASDYHELIISLQLKDFISLDESVGAEKTGIEVSDLLFSEYLIAVGCRFIDRKSLPSSEKAELYKWLFTKIYNVQGR